jgi:glutamate dehydrogenase
MASGRGGGVIDEVVSLTHQRLGEDRATEAETFVRLFLEGVPPRDLDAVAAADLYGAVMANWNLARRRAVGSPNVRVYTPDLEQHGWTSSHTVVDIVTDDMPFLVDSVSMGLSRRDLGIHLVVHPMMDVRRDGDGQLVEVTGRGSATDARTEAFLHVEIDRQSEPETLRTIRDAMVAVLADVRAAVEDWSAMRAQVHRIVDQLGSEPQPIDEDELEEGRRFLTWLDDDHFTFLGYRAYDLEARSDGDVIVSQPDTGLGLLRDAPPSETHLAEQPPEVRDLARAEVLLNLTKANSRSTVHRPSYLDYVGVKRFGPDGETIGEWRFLGLYTSRVYTGSPHDIPVLRGKVTTVLSRAAFPPHSHDAKDLAAILETYPRDELFEVTADELYALAMGILGLQERRQVRLFLRRDRFGRYFSCLVFLPRDRYTTASRLRIEDVLTEALEGTGLEHAVRLSESVLARLHFLVRVAPGQLREPDVEDVERRLSQAIRTWTDDLADALLDELGEERGRRELADYGEAFPAAYREDHPARLGVADLERLRALDPAGDLAMSLYRPVEAGDEQVRLKLYRSGAPSTLSEVLPLLENMGFDVIDQKPYAISPARSSPVWIHDFGLVSPPPGPLASERSSAAFEEAFARVWHGDTEDDGFNRLVLRAGLTSREVTVLRAYSKYLRQTATRFSQS